MSHSNPSFGEVARWRGYFALDSLKGGFIKERYRDDVFAYRNGYQFDADGLVYSDTSGVCGDLADWSFDREHEQ